MYGDHPHFMKFHTDFVSKYYMHSSGFQVFNTNSKLGAYVQMNTRWEDGNRHWIYVHVEEKKMMFLHLSSYFLIGKMLLPNEKEHITGAQEMAFLKKKVNA